MGLTRREIDEAVRDSAWQNVRLSMKGKPTERKLNTLHEWLTLGQPTGDVMREVQVLNYLNAMSRGGLIKPVEQVRGSHLRHLLHPLNRKSRIRIIR
jgi:hypothetical protein